MVTTRGRRSVVVVDVKDSTPTRSRRIKDDAPRQPEATPEEPEGTIGSRLRKRRFAAIDASSSSADKSSDKKRPRRSLTPAIVEPTSSPPSSTSMASRKRHNANKSPERTAKRRRESTSAAASSASPKVSQLPIREKAPPASESSVPPRHPDLQSLSLEEQFKTVLPQNPTLRLDEEKEAAVISKIIRYSEQVAQYAQWGKNVDTEGMQTMGADPELKKEALPILANLTMQVLHVFATYSVTELTVIMAFPPERNFEVHRGLYDLTKKIYATKDAFISISDLPSDPADAAKIARNANLATFVTSCFGTQEVGFYHLNDYFLETFVNDGSRLLKQQAGLYLELKTQAYLSAMSNFERTKDRVLNELFPLDLEQQLLNRRAGARSLHPSEIDFVERARNRRRLLEQQPEAPDALDILKDRYKWDTFLSDLANYLNKNYEAIVGKPVSTITPMCGDGIASRRRIEPIGTGPEQRPPSPSYVEQTSPLSTVGNPSKPEQAYQGTQPAGHHRPPPPPAYWYPLPPPTHSPMSGPPPPPPMHANDDIVAKAQRAAQEAFQSYLPTGHTMVNGVPRPPPNPYHGPYPPNPPPPTTFYPPSLPQHSQPPGGPQHSPPYGQPPYGPLMPPHQQPSYQLTPRGPGPWRPEDHPFMHLSVAPLPARPTEYYVPHPFVPPPFQGMSMPPPGYMYVPHGQSLPTAVLYEKARTVANSKSSSGGRNKASNVSQRRPWTTEEEQALMAGIDQVKGPHWSQILALYGPGGTISEALRDRTQVQLKDKARNLKLFFLKSGIEVPYYLGFVTGELKSRAPSHVAYDKANGSENATPEKNGSIASHPEGEAGPEAPSTSTPILPHTPVQSIENTTAVPTMPQTGPKAAENGTYTSPYTAIPPPAPVTLAPSSNAIASANIDANIDPTLGLDEEPVEPVPYDSWDSPVRPAARALALLAVQEATEAISAQNSDEVRNGKHKDSAEKEAAPASVQIKKEPSTVDGDGDVVMAENEIGNVGSTRGISS